MSRGSFCSLRKLIERLLRRTIERLGIGWVCGVALTFAAVPAGGEDWGMGAANRQIARGAVFSPVSTPASSIATLAWFILAVSAAIFLIVFGLLVYSVVRFRIRATDEPREPAQLYGSNQIEFAWTAIPVLIVFVLVLATIRTIYDVQAAAEPRGAVHVRVIGHHGGGSFNIRIWV